MKNSQERDLKNIILDAIEQIFGFLEPYLLRIFSLLNPRNDHGIENLRLRGLVHLLIGISSVVIAFIVGGILGSIGIIVSDLLSSPIAYELLGDFFIVLFVIGSLVPILLSILVVNGLFEMILNREWDEANRILRFGAVVFAGIPIAIVILFSYFALVTNLVDLIRGSN